MAFFSYTSKQVWYSFWKFGEMKGGKIIKKIEMFILFISEI